MQFGYFTLTDTPPAYGAARRNPQQFLLDVLSDGRAIFSAGRGYDKREYDAFAIPFHESRERFDEEMQLVRKAWVEEEFTFAGTFHRVVEPLTVLPRPVQ